MASMATLELALLHQKGFECENILGEGVFGKVVKARKEDKTYAIKILPCKIEDRQDLKGPYQKRELILLTQMTFSDNPNVIKYFGSWKMQVASEQVLCIQMELCSENLRDFVYKNKAGPKIIQTLAQGQPRFYQQVFKQILNGLIAIHSAGWVHRDIHPGNILVVNPNPQQISGIAIKIGDFGLARCIEKDVEVSPKSWTVKVQNKTPVSPCLKPGLYRAPEIFTDAYNFKVDLYNAGIVLYFISRYLEEKDRSKLDSEIEQLKKRKIKVNEYVYHKDDEKLCNLIENLLEPLAHNRLTALEAMKYMFPTQGMDSTGSRKAPKTEFFARKDDEEDLSRCHLNKFTLSAMREAVRYKIGVAVDKQELRQERLINGEKRRVKVDDDEDVSAMFRNAKRRAKDGQNVVVVVRLKPLRESNVEMEQTEFEKGREGSTSESL